MFFIVSTGRSGTTTIADLLNQSPDCLCVHEPEPVLIEEAVRYLYGDLESEELKQILQSTRFPTTPEKLEYGESNQKLSFIIPLLHEMYREASFIWLIRDGRDVVASLMKRKWYTNKPLNIWRLWHLEGNRVDPDVTDKWHTMTPFAKCCWYWNFVNQLIEKSVTETDIRFMTVRLEDLDIRTNDLFSFLNLSKPTEIKVKTLNASREGTIRPWFTWTQEQRQTFSQICGTTMDKFYPEWRSEFEELSSDTSQNLQISKKRLKSLLKPVARFLGKSTSSIISNTSLYFLRYFSKEPVSFSMIEQISRLSENRFVFDSLNNHKILQNQQYESEGILWLDSLPQTAFTISRPTIDTLRDYVINHKPQNILEFGCGTSTAFLAYWAQHFYRDLDPPTIYSIEQDKNHIAQTKQLLEAHGLDQLVKFLYAPLITYTTNGISVKCYNLNEEVLSNFLREDSPDLILIDGPSGIEMNRLGTLLQVLPVIKQPATFFLDDALQLYAIKVARQWGKLPNIEIKGVYLTDRGLLVGKVKNK